MNPDDKQIQEMVNEVDQIKKILAQADIITWLAKLDNTIELLKTGQYKKGADQILNFYGYMGSIDDLIICPANGHPVSEDQGKELTKQLREHSDRLLNLANVASKGS